MNNLLQGWCLNVLSQQKSILDRSLRSRRKTLDYLENCIQRNETTLNFNKSSENKTT